MPTSRFVTLPMRDVLRADRSGTGAELLLRGVNPAWYGVKLQNQKESSHSIAFTVEIRGP
jgi:hypothetical protein